MSRLTEKRCSTLVTVPIRARLSYAHIKSLTAMAKSFHCSTAAVIAALIAIAAQDKDLQARAMLNLPPDRRRRYLTTAREDFIIPPTTSGTVLRRRHYTKAAKPSTSKPQHPSRR